MARKEPSVDEHIADAKAWKSALRSTPEGEADYQAMAKRAIEASERLATSPST